MREIALEYCGYVTTKEAAAVGVPVVERPKLAARGSLEIVGCELSRVPDTPRYGLDQFAEALLRTGDGAFLHGESVLAIFGLADVNPRKFEVAVRERTRPKLPPFIESTHVRADVLTTRYEGLESQLLVDAILERRGRIKTVRLMAAAKQVRKEGLVNHRVAACLEAVVVVTYTDAPRGAVDHASTQATIPNTNLWRRARRQPVR